MNTLNNSVKRHPMKVIEGIRGVTTRTTYSYRGHKIIQVRRWSDPRNKTHNGYKWEVQFNSETPGGAAWTRSHAKMMINSYVDAQ